MTLDNYIRYVDNSGDRDNAIRMWRDMVGYASLPSEMQGDYTTFILMFHKSMKGASYLYNES